PSWRGGDGGKEGVVVVEVTAVCDRRDGDGVDGWMMSMRLVSSWWWCRVGWGWIGGGDVLTWW
ncbi:hypothetical protein Tco_0165905, partial [Tanacetum coccineum]